MQDTAVERWSRLDGWLHRRDARLKLLSMLAVLIAIGTATNLIAVAVHAVLLIVVAWSAALPVAGLLVRSLVVLPFAGTFAVLAAIAGNLLQGVLMLVRAELSALAVLLLVGTTPMPRLFAALRKLGAPRMLVLSMQFLYRFLFVTAEQSGRMRQAAAARGGTRRHRRLLLQAAAGTVATLFATSYARAGRVWRAMLARGFSGDFPVLVREQARTGDWLLLTLALAVSAGTVVWL